MFVKGDGYGLFAAAIGGGGPVPGGGVTRLFAPVLVEFVGDCLEHTLRRLAGRLQRCLVGRDRRLEAAGHPFELGAGWLAAAGSRANLWIEVRDLWPEAAVETGLKLTPNDHWVT